ncbi:argininosuccinate lyase [Vulgatibacter incomptus]|uniref:Argininosuccinate lyase n=1 Tax=Vulgatibacter incomptus TaxID=1391653 RepID=A0A0K1PA89_9BACT|nr:argininosuccinate lyase [Vulgatibacter incomptus]AKU90417.1 Argininosuccinate lyase [Vulgatibacter incomptus]
MIAKTAAAGGPGLHPEMLAFSSSLDLDIALLREDLLGSLAHLTMLSRCGIIPREAAAELKAGLLSIRRAADDGTLELPAEEDVHMAVEAWLHANVGAAAGLLHTGRSRNDQVAVDLKLHVREQVLVIREALARLVLLLVERAEGGLETLLPAYTHRQRAQPVSLAYWYASYAAMVVRDLDAFAFVQDQVDSMPLGVGAIAGTTLPNDREILRGLLGFTRITVNGLDTVGDRDFALDYAYAAARFLLHASRLSTDLVDFTSAEFGFAKLDDEIACGSSMMPQKKNPDAFELVRGKSGKAVGNLVNLLVTVKGLPGGYNRDLQEDRGPLLETGKLVRGVASILQLALPRVHFQPERCLAALEADATQATDLAEALVKKGLPFRTAYQAVGKLVRACQERGLPLGSATPELAASVDPVFDAATLEAASIKGALARKQSAGSTGLEPVRAQLAQLRARADAELGAVAKLPRLDALFASLEAAAL